MYKGQKVFINVDYEVTVLEIDKKVAPGVDIEDFAEWLKYKAVELGTGKHHEYYAYTEDYKDDIGVLFKVEPLTINDK